MLTVNRRLARTLMQQLNQQQLDSGAEVWPTAEILPLPTWLEQCWEQHLDHASDDDSQPISPNLVSPNLASPNLTLLTAWQERLLWEEIISQSSPGSGLLRVSEAAHNAQKAWKLLQEWQTSLTAEDLYNHEDAQAFHLWATEFTHSCQQNNWLDQARLTAYLCQQCDHLSLPKTILLAGFQRQTPAFKTLFTTLEQAGVTIKTLPVASVESNKPPQRVAFASTDAEIEAAAHWSRTLLSAEPSRTIAIVAPALETLLPQMIEVFSRVFYPGNNPNSLNPLSPIFNISLGVRLPETALIQDALLLLTLGKQQLSLEQYTALLHSPFWRGGQTERSERTLLDSRLRNTGLLHISAAQLQKEAMRREHRSPPCPQLVKVLGQFISLCQADSNQQQAALPSVWSVRFSQWLTLLGWPGEQSLSSGEFQNHSAWQRALATFASLDKMVESLSLTDALAHLKRLLNEISFQPESGIAPIQILGLLEAVGGSYDHLWIMGLSEEAWPPPLEPNPFLPMGFQRQHGMPKSSYEIEIAYDTKLLSDLTKTAREVIISYPNQKGDQPLRPSPLIMAIPELEIATDPAAANPTTGPATDPTIMAECPSHFEQTSTALGISLFPDYHYMIHDSAEISSNVDDRGPKFEMNHQVSTSVIQAQAHCPFQAFARFRLEAQAPYQPDMGLNASQRGQMVHSAITHLWENIGSTQADMEQIIDAPNAVINTSVTKTLQQEWPPTLHPFFRQLEQSRLERLAQQVLQMENQRHTPFTLQGQEVESSLTLGQLKLRIRMDRIDQLEDGSLVVLDYKTGQAKINGWFGDRPSDPQLPLYALAQKEPVTALAFFQVRANRCGFYGLACQEDILPAVSTLEHNKQAAQFEDWPSLQHYWENVMTQLSNAFVAGKANIDPLPTACTYCDLRSLCRYDEVML